MRQLSGQAGGSYLEKQKATRLFAVPFFILRDESKLILS